MNKLTAAINSFPCTKEAAINSFPYSKEIALVQPLAMLNGCCTHASALAFPPGKTPGSQRRCVRGQLRRSPSCSTSVAAASWPGRDFEGAEGSAAAEDVPR